MFLRPTAVCGARALSTMRAAAALPRDLFADRSVFITGAVHGRAGGGGQEGVNVRVKAARGGRADGRAGAAAAPSGPAAV